ncbi:helix-turn-helix domain-containing protein [Planococcus halotolerans]|uniref:XRE family transcriptional regulator n=1 Tax=Planococcus halotolerans TaxID=2233542 RepID=A0A365L6J5_9BACL|nr:helix-turn-helix transcriptional regulator [Planococcus halotolerans]QHJ70236.1 helix-turn-helix domain-containing protein [Planococcus halotolerans]RAZ81034.1 XRE family transcriptional regulator [Planococcus halotolerans]
MEVLSKKIKQLREEKGISPEKLAEDIGFAKSTIWAYESGKKQISVSHLARLADYFDVSIDNLLDREERMIDLDLLNLTSFADYNLLLDNKPLNRDEIAEAASYIKVKRRMGSFGVATS